MLKKRGSYWKYLVVLFIIILALVLFVILYKTTPALCDTQECFFSKMAICEPSKFIYSGNITFSYIIQGRDEDSCAINVKLIRSYWRGNTFDSLKGKSMTCDIALGKTLFPEEDLNNCHGELKEKLQELILQKIHGYIIENLAI